MKLLKIKFFGRFEFWFGCLLWGRAHSDEAVSLSLELPDMCHVFKMAP